jgi:uncharacterized protein YqeY
MMMKDDITAALKVAMRARDAVALSALRGLLAAIKNAEIAAGKALDDRAVQAHVRTQIKQLGETIDGFVSAGRDDEVESERSQITLLKAFIPAPMSDAEVDALVVETIAAIGATSMREMGAVMGRLTAAVSGRADGKTLAAKVRQALS